MAYIFFLCFSKFTIVALQSRHNCGEMMFLHRGLHRLLTLRQPAIHMETVELAGPLLVPTLSL